VKKEGRVEVVGDSDGERWKYKKGIRMDNFHL